MFYYIYASRGQMIAHKIYNFLGKERLRMKFKLEGPEEETDETQTIIYPYSWKHAIWEPRSNYAWWQATSTSSSIPTAYSCSVTSDGVLPSRASWKDGTTALCAALAHSAVVWQHVYTALRSRLLRTAAGTSDCSTTVQPNTTTPNSASTFYEVGFTFPVHPIPKQRGIAMLVPHLQPCHQAVLSNNLVFCTRFQQASGRRGYLYITKTTHCIFEFARVAKQGGTDIWRMEEVIHQSPTRTCLLTKSLRYSPSNIFCYMH